MDPPAAARVGNGVALETEWRPKTFCLALALLSSPRYRVAFSSSLLFQTCEVRGNMEVHDVDGAKRNMSRPLSVSFSISYLRKISQPSRLS